MKGMLAATACAVLLSPPVAAQDQALVAKGRDLAVKNKCAMCHVIDGKGGKIASPLDGVAERHKREHLARILTDPVKEFPDAKIKMPKVAWAQGEVDAVIAYLQTLKAASK